jgi:hypothetical protein
VAKPGAGQSAQPLFGSLDDFVWWLTRAYRREIFGDGRTRVWAARWWERQHEEAINRLLVMWLAYEQAIAQGGGAPSSIWVYHFDHHMQVLMMPDGPFAGAKGEENACGRGEPLPYLPPPATSPFYNPDPSPRRRPPTPVQISP